MTFSDALGGIFAATAPEREGRDAGYSLNVAVVYQDALAQEWAEQVGRRIARRAGDEAVQSHSWPADLLRHPEVFAEAVRVASRADLILVSVHAADRLPRALGAWIHAWLPLRDRKPGALVALIGVTDTSCGQASLTSDYLRAAAKKGALDFLSQEQTVPSEATRVHLETALPNTLTATHVLPTVLDTNPVAYFHWGINE